MEDPELTCDICGKSYSRKDTVVLHKKKVHGILSDKKKGRQSGRSPSKISKVGRSPKIGLTPAFIDDSSSEDEKVSRKVSAESDDDNKEPVQARKKTSPYKKARKESLTSEDEDKKVENKVVSDREDAPHDAQEESMDSKESVSNDAHDSSGSDITCDTCGKGFSTRGYLRNHKKWAHSYKPSLSEDELPETEFECHICRKTYPRAKQLDKHISYRHDNSSSKKKKKSKKRSRFPEESNETVSTEKGESVKPVTEDGSESPAKSSKKPKLSEQDDCDPESLSKEQDEEPESSTISPECEQPVRSPQSEAPQPESPEAEPAAAAAAAADDEEVGSKSGDETMPGESVAEREESKPLSYEEEEEEEDENSGLSSVLDKGVKSEIFESLSLSGSKATAATTTNSSFLEAAGLSVMTFPIRMSPSEQSDSSKTTTVASVPSSPPGGAKPPAAAEHTSRRLLKLWSEDGKVKKCVGAASLKELISKGKPKLGFGSRDKVVVCMMDGTEIDDDDELLLLPLDYPLTLKGVPGRQESDSEEPPPAKAAKIEKKSSEAPPPAKAAKIEKKSSEAPPPAKAAKIEKKSSEAPPPAKAAKIEKKSVSADRTQNMADQQSEKQSPLSVKERTKSTEEYPKAKKSETPAKQQSGKWITATPQVPKSLEKTPKNTGKTQKIVENESKDLEKMSKAVEKMPKVVEKVGSSTKQEKSSSKKCSSSKGVAEHTDDDEPPPVKVAKKENIFPERLKERHLSEESRTTVDEEEKERTKSTVKKKRFKGVPAARKTPKLVEERDSSASLPASDVDSPPPSPHSKRKQHLKKKEYAARLERLTCSQGVARIALRAFPCEECSQRFSRGDLLKQHLRRHRKGLLDHKPKRHIDTLARFFVCGKCMAIFSAAKKLEQHKKIRHRLTSDDNGDNVGEEGGDESTAGEEVASQDEKTSINSEKEETDVDDNESKNKDCKKDDQAASTKTEKEKLTNKKPVGKVPGPFIHRKTKQSENNPKSEGNENLTKEEMMDISSEDETGWKSKNKSEQVTKSVSESVEKDKEPVSESKTKPCESEEKDDKSESESVEKDKEPVGESKTKPCESEEKDDKSESESVEKDKEPVGESKTKPCESEEKDNKSESESVEKDKEPVGESKTKPCESEEKDDKSESESVEKDKEPVGESKTKPCESEEKDDKSESESDSRGGKYSVETTKEDKVICDNESSKTKKSGKKWKSNAIISSDDDSNGKNSESDNELKSNTATSGNDGENGSLSKDKNGSKTKENLESVQKSLDGVDKKAVENNPAASEAKLSDNDLKVSNVGPKGDSKRVRESETGNDKSSKNNTGTSKDKSDERVGKTGSAEKSSKGLDTSKAGDGSIKNSTTNEGQNSQDKKSTVKSSQEKLGEERDGKGISTTTPPGDKSAPAGGGDGSEGGKGKVVVANINAESTLSVSKEGTDKKEGEDGGAEAPEEDINDAVDKIMKALGLLN